MAAVSDGRRVRLDSAGGLDARFGTRPERYASFGSSIRHVRSQRRRGTGAQVDPAWRQSRCARLASALADADDQLERFAASARCRVPSSTICSSSVTISFWRADQLFVRRHRASGRSSRRPGRLSGKSGGSRERRVRPDAMDGGSASRVGLERRDSGHVARLNYRAHGVRTVLQIPVQERDADALDDRQLGLLIGVWR